MGSFVDSLTNSTLGSLGLGAPVPVSAALRNSRAIPAVQGAALSQYRPNWRERVRDGIRDTVAALGVSPYTASRTASQATGLLDWTPVGAVYGARDAALSAAQSPTALGALGNTALAGINLATLPIPGAGKVVETAAARAAERLAERAADAAPEAIGITAYHGSPHSFDAFDSSKIGTGEGAQAYGHGLYFAGDEKVADYYRKGLSGPSPNFDGTIDPELKQSLRAVDFLGFDTAGEALQGMRQHPDWAARWDLSASEEAAIRDRFDAHEARKYGGSGHMYQVHINAEPDDFVDWDAPLPETARNAVEKSLEPLRLGQAGLKSFWDKAGNAGFAINSAERASPRGDLARRLQEAGYAGIRYLDQVSRAAGDGSRNYVVFNDKLVTILKKYGWVPGTALPAGLMARAQTEASAPPAIGPAT